MAHPCSLMSEFTLVAVAEIAKVRYDEVVDELNLHHHSRIVQAFSQCIVLAARRQTARRVVMTQRNMRGTRQQCLLEHQPDVDHRSGNATSAD